MAAVSPTLVQGALALLLAAASARARAEPTPRPGTGILELRTQPAGAMALLDGRLLGVTPVRVEVPAGLHMILLRKEGTSDQNFPVKVVPGQLVRETRTLILSSPGTDAAVQVPAPDEPASLIVFSDPRGATVYVDDEPIGDTDPATGRLVKTGLAPGSHRLRLAKEGFEEAVREVPVAASGATEVRVALSPAAAGFSPFLTALLATTFAALLILGWQRVRGPRGPAVPAASAEAPTPVDGGPRTLLPSDPKAEARPSTPAAGQGPTEPSAAREGEGELFGEYTLRETLGKGGMAVVFLAERGDQLVALKRPLPGCLDDAEFRERFEREVELGRTLSHPNIIRMFEQGEVLGVPFFTMEYLQGQTLHARLKETGAFAPGEACRIVFQVAEALDYAHHKGVVHRDLKPSNIMLLPEGTVKVMDYGIARARRFEGITITGAFMGTPDYVAPEIAEGRGTDARSDLYSLGVVFYELLAGRKPFVGDTPFATLRMHVSDAPKPPSSHMPETPRELEAVVLRLLAKDPNDRYPSAEDLLLDLRGYLNRAA